MTQRGTSSMDSIRMHVVQHEGKERLGKELVAGTRQMTVPWKVQRRLPISQKHRQQILKRNARLGAHLADETLRPQRVGREAIHDRVTRKAFLQ